MNLIVRVILAGVLLGVVSFFYYQYRNPEPPTPAQILEASKANSGELETAQYDGHLFIVVKGHHEGPRGIVHHPGCHCFQRIPDPSILEHMNGRQHLPNNGGILER